ncbi:hypothetical protein [uncultured Megasphaera sp.]|uniref:hypothetical protein n=1 Tax=uncultured Megasphaera sp. TaxID=165188 RepID=UPI002595EFC5|nr:hypothetical protein [uncultured Megasphaera sp.]
MAYTLEQIYEALGKIENGGTMVADLQDAIRGARDEAAKSRIEKNKILDALNLRNGGDPDGNLQNIVATLTALQAAGGDPSKLGTQVEALQAQVKDLTDKYAASEKTAAEEKEKRIQTAMKSQVLAALTDGKAIKPDVFTQVLLSHISAKDDGSLVYKEGDNEVSIADGVKGWLSKNPWAVKNDSRSGSGEAGGVGTGSGGKAYTMEDLKGMTRAEINEHWGEISKGIDKGDGN